MFGIQTSELVVIALVAILLFGPERVPEFFHRAGRLMSKVQRSADDLWTSLQTEMNQATKPLEDVGKEIKALGEGLMSPSDEPASGAGTAAGDASDEAADEAENTPDEPGA